MEERTCGPTPPGDAAGVVGLEELRGPGDADGADGRVVLQAFLLEGKLLQLQQSDVVLVVGTVPAVVQRMISAVPRWIKSRDSG